MSKSFSEQVTEGMAKSQTTEHRKAYDALQEIAEGIKVALDPKIIRSVRGRFGAGLQNESGATVPTSA